MAKKFLIVGNPNTGKTTLFNSLTGLNEKTGNYSGVTVDQKSKQIKFGQEWIELVDLPGVYTLKSSNPDEIVTKEYLKEHKHDSVLFVCSSCDIKKNMILLQEVARNGHEVVVLINKIGKGLKDDSVNKLQESLGVPILQADVRKGKEELLDFISSTIAQKITNDINLDNLLKLLPSTPEQLAVVDKFLLHKVWGRLLFFFVFVSVLIISYGTIGGLLLSKLEGVLDKVDQFVVGYITPTNISWLLDFWSNVIIGGVGQVLIYLPQLALMLTMLYLLEDIGYLPRVSALFNYRLEKFGMNGQSVFSLVMGVGCTTSAMLATRNIGMYSARVSTAKMLPYIGCSAKLPIFIFVTQMLFGGKGVIYVGLIYLSSIMIGGLYLSLTESKNDKSRYFITEIPKLKIPSLTHSIKQSLIIVVRLFRKIIVTVLISTTLLWLLLNISSNLKFFTGEKSLLESLAEFIGVAFIPLGLNHKEVIIALIAGFVAKENVMSTMGLFSGFGGLSTIQTMTFLIFVMLYSPCVSAIKCTRCEFGGRFALKLTLIQLLVAYVASFVFSTFARISIVVGFVALLFGVVLILATIKLFSQVILSKRKIIPKSA